MKQKNVFLNVIQINIIHHLINFVMKNVMLIKIILFQPLMKTIKKFVIKNAMNHNQILEKITFVKMDVKN